MDLNEKKEILADIFEMEVEEITGELVLEELDTWDSVAVLAIIAFMGERFGKYPVATFFKDFQTMQEIMDIME